MKDKNWNHFRDKTQLEFLPVSIACLGVFLILAASRDAVFSDFSPPVWVTLLDIVSIGVFIIAFAVTLMKWLRPGDAKVFLFMCFVAVSLRPSIIVLFDGTPGTLVLCSVIFASGIVFLNLPFLLVSQALTLASWALVVYEDLLSVTYLVTVVVALITCGLAYWLQRTRLRSLMRSYELEMRVENLETIVPMCASCKKTRDDSGNWMSVEQFIESADSTLVSHGICPDCKEEQYGDMLRNRDARKNAEAS